MYLPGGPSHGYCSTCMPPGPGTLRSCGDSGSEESCATEERDEEEHNAAPISASC